MKVKDSAAVVVGGASGMGRATAERLAERGAKVAILDLPRSDGAAVAKELGRRRVISPVRRDRSRRRRERAARGGRGVGGLHIAVNTAGGGISAAHAVQERAAPIWTRSGR